jgi:hypothetical protein
MWSCGSSRPFIELTRAEQLSELDFGWLRVHIRIDWRPKGWNEAEFQARLARWWSESHLGTSVGHIASHRRSTIEDDDNA